MDLVKILFEELHFKASFGGKEGRAVMGSKRKRIPEFVQQRNKRQTTMLFSFEGGDVESSIIQRRVQRPRRDIDLHKFSQVQSEIDKRSIDLEGT